MENYCLWIGSTARFSELFRLQFDLWNLYSHCHCKRSSEKTLYFHPISHSAHFVRTETRTSKNKTNLFPRSSNRKNKTETKQSSSKLDLNQIRFVNEAKSALGSLTFVKKRYNISLPIINGVVMHATFWQLLIRLVLKRFIPIYNIAKKSVRYAVFKLSYNSLNLSQHWSEPILQFCCPSFLKSLSHWSKTPTYFD